MVCIIGQNNKIIIMENNLNNYQKLTSAQNNQIKLLNKLALKKYRYELGQFAVENLTIIYDALKSGYDFEALFITQDFINKCKAKFQYLQAHSQCQNCYLIDEKLNKQYSLLDTPSGITAVYNIKVKKLTDGSAVYLNGVSDPGNLGAIMRNALAFGFANLVLDETCADIYNFKTINAAKDAIFKLNILYDADAGWLKKNTLPVYAASSQAGRNLADFKPALAFCLVLGNESQGLSPKIKNRADEIIKIEMSAQIESLNVTAAAAILLYKLRQI